MGACPVPIIFALPGHDNLKVRANVPIRLHFILFYRSFFFFDRYTRCPETLLIFGMIIELETKRYIFGGDVIFRGFERSKFGLLNNVQY